MLNSELSKVESVLNLLVNHLLDKSHNYNKVLLSGYVHSEAERWDNRGVYKFTLMRPDRRDRFTVLTPSIDNVILSKEILVHGHLRSNLDYRRTWARVLVYAHDIVIVGEKGKKEGYNLKL